MSLLTHHGAAHTEFWKPPPSLLVVGHCRWSFAADVRQHDVYIKFIITVRSVAVTQCRGAYIVMLYTFKR